ncbi:MAG: helix-turn-helix domain-containing protein [Saprospiraceae bacterium]|nr:helix-turn-helix domain-containing protein [Saprospiraceae bacterium]
MNVITIEEEAFFKLVSITIERMQGDSKNEKPKWIGEDDAMKLLHIRSKTTLQKLRNEGKIRYSQPMHKVILYDRESILQLIEDNAKDTF